MARLKVYIDGQFLVAEFPRYRADIAMLPGESPAACAERWLEQARTDSATATRREIRAAEILDEVKKGVV